MLKWRSESSGTRVVSHPAHADLGDRGGAPEAALPGRRGALPQAAGRSRAPRARGGARGRAGAAADPGPLAPGAARGRRPPARLARAEPLAGGAAPGGPRPLLRDRRAARARPRQVRHAALARADHAAAPARARRPARAALPGAQDPGPRAVSLLVPAWTPSPTSPTQSRKPRTSWQAKAGARGSRAPPPPARTSGGT